MLPLLPARVLLYHLLELLFGPLGLRPMILVEASGIRYGMKVTWV